MISSLPNQKISADYHLSPLERVSWLKANLITTIKSNFAFSSSSRRLSFSALPGIARPYFNNINTLKSPSRFLCEEYLYREFVCLFTDITNQTISIYDFGCGDSSMLFIVKKAYIDTAGSSRNLKINYIGYDPFISEIAPSFEIPSWLEVTRSEKFSPSYMNSVSSAIDICVSFSVLEHVFDDISQINLITRFSTLQLHFVPSWCCLFTYLWHGYRVYNPFIIENLRMHLSVESNLQIYPIGSFMSSLTYIIFTLFPQITFFLTKKIFKTVLHKDCFRLKLKKIYRIFLATSVINSKNSPTFPSFLLLKIS